MITSANLSQQAWGWTIDKNGQVRIASYEIGVVVWPGLFKENDGEAEVIMVPTFGRDMPEAGDVVSGETAIPAKTVIGVRMPYDLPLVPYDKSDVPWCTTMAHREPDWRGNVWGGYKDRM
jgi:tyrosyl-DNA phosphodiesterase-1